MILYSLFDAIINYFTKTYNVSSFVMFLQVKKKILKNNTNSLYNLINASTILNLMIKMIERNVMQSREMFIIIFYRAQFKFYKQILRNLSLMKSKIVKYSNSNNELHARMSKIIHFFRFDDLSKVKLHANQESCERDLF
jgi:hypothetical protein